MSLPKPANRAFPPFTGRAGWNEAEVAPTYFRLVPRLGGMYRGNRMTAWERPPSTLGARPRAK